MNIIYKSTNKINGKSYIGQTTRDLDFYIKEHYRKARLKCDGARLFHAAIRKYGQENFEWEILCECEEELLDEKEQFYIQKFNTFVGDKNSHGYNMTRGGTTTCYEYTPKLFAAPSFKGKTHSPENKELFSALSKQRWDDPEYRKKMSTVIRKRRKSAAAMYATDPVGYTQKLEVGLEVFCEQHDLPFTTVRRWVNKGRIQFNRPLKHAATRNAEGWEFKSEARYYS